MELLSCDVALIAGSGRLPRLILEQMRAQGLRPLLFNISDPGSQDPGSQDPGSVDCESSDRGSVDLSRLATVTYRIQPIELVKALKLMKLHGAKEVTMAGRVPHQLLLKLRPWHLNFRLLKLWWGLADTRADTILRAVVQYFDDGGVPVVSSLKYLTDYVLTRCSMMIQGSKVAGNPVAGNPVAGNSVARNRVAGNRVVDRDVLLGIVAAKTLGAIDVGQSVVVSRGTVVAVEGLEGTDGCLDRVIALGVRSALLVKMAKPGQDFRFDLPTVGDQTFRRLKEGGFRALVVEEGATLCTDREALKSLQESGVELIVADRELIRLAFETYHPDLGELLLTQSPQNRSGEAPHREQCPHKSID